MVTGTGLWSVFVGAIRKMTDPACIKVREHARGHSQPGKRSRCRGERRLLLKPYVLGE